LVDLDGAGDGAIDGPGDGDFDDFLEDGAADGAIDGPGDGDFEVFPSLGAADAVFVAVPRGSVGAGGGADAVAVADTVEDAVAAEFVMVLLAVDAAAGLL